MISDCEIRDDSIWMIWSVEGQAGKVEIFSQNLSGKEWKEAEKWEQPCQIDEEILVTVTVTSMQARSIFCNCLEIDQFGQFCFRQKNQRNASSVWFWFKTEVLMSSVIGAICQFVNLRFHQKGSEPKSYSLEGMQPFGWRKKLCFFCKICASAVTAVPNAKKCKTQKEFLKHSVWGSGRGQKRTLFAFCIFFFTWPLEEGIYIGVNFPVNPCSCLFQKFDVLSFVSISLQT